MRTCLLLILVLSSPVSAQEVPLIGATPDEYSAWVKRFARDERVSFVDACWDGKTVRYAASTIKDGRSWDARIGLTADQYQKLFNELGGKGYRLLSLRGYFDGTTTRFASAWMQDDTSELWSSWQSLTAREYQTNFASETLKGMRPAHLAGFSVPGEAEGSHRLSVVFRAGEEQAYQARHDLTAVELTKTLEDMIGAGYRPMSISGYASGNRTLFTALFIADPHASVARQELTPEECRDQDRRLAKSGYRLASISGYLSGGELRYAAVWMREKPRVLYKEWPTTGKEVPGMQSFDQAMLRVMKERNIPAGTLAVSKDGKLLLSRGYGFADREGKKPIAPDAPFRLASIGKPITAAAIRKLVRDGKLSMDTKAFALLDVKPLPGAKSDPRLKDITIQHLLDHKGGWDRDATFDPMFRPIAIATALGKDTPATADDVVRWMRGQPLQFDPGSRFSYSNFGYCVLGRVIEKVTGKSYIDAIRRDLLDPLGITSVEVGRTLPGARNPREPFYSEPFRGLNVFQMKRTSLVPAADGTFHLEAMDSHGGLIGSAPDLTKFMDAYWLNGEPRRGGTSNYAAFGLLPGTWTLLLQRSDGVNVAVLFNQRTDPSGLKYDLIRNALDRAADSLRGSSSR